MSTRGCVAVGTVNRWRGVYNHYDSYPTGLGSDLYEHLIARVVKDGKTLAEIGDDLLKFDDWRNYLKGGVCEYCGKIAGQPHSIRGDIAMAKDNGSRKYPDPEAKYHEHNDLTDVAAEQITSANPDPLFLEWVYIIDPKADVIHVLRHESCKLTRVPKNFDHRNEGCRKLSGGRYHYGHCVFKHVHVCDLTLTEKPDWTKVECGETFQHCNHYAYHHFPELADKPSGMIGTGNYLEYEPMDSADDACAFLVKGKFYRKGSRGFAGGETATRMGLYGTESEVWYQSVIGTDGIESDEPVAYQPRKGGRTPYKGVVWIFPPTLMSDYTSLPAIENLRAKLPADVDALLQKAGVR
jgi:hypothetical protein